ncbi:hypothetical protein [Streptomyces gobiensis]|uniref:hypothetical protein n=1 Tax=Streptomyces gobiensis TaxID=2875706 RepID=UPI001E63452F|nr:hypothetical protein [Streptomyces gobiensis]UGY92196.1 hypothetical protein test1122_10955 [Streptomyces gobiensis]
MRCLKAAPTVAAASTVSVLLATALTACGSGGGIRVEQSAAASDSPHSKITQLPASPLPTDSGAEAGSPKPSATPSGGAQDSPEEPPLPTAAVPVSPPGADRELDIVALLKADPAVGAAVKRDLHPCTRKAWPIDLAYGRLTRAAASDVVVNVSTCADGKGVGSYVYRQNRAGEYVNVFADEEPAVYAEIDKGALQVYQQIYFNDDPVCCPSGEDVVTYVWRDGKFAELDRAYKEYPKTTAGAGETGGEG